MKEYPSIEDFFVEENPVVVAEEVESQIMEHMDVFSTSVDMNETEAYNSALNIILNC